jgi:hypothetical protein
MARVYTSTSVDTTLTASLGAGVTTCTVADAVGLLGSIAGNTISATNTFTIAIDPDTASEEIVVVTGVSGSTLTIIRAQAGTTDIAHSSAATVRHVLTSMELTEFATKADTQTLTNKTINLSSNTLTGTTAQFNTALSDNNFATQAGAETLTNKTIAFGDNTITGVSTPSSTDTFTNKSIALGSNTVTGTIAQFNTAVTDADFATIAGTETLTNKILTSPVLNAPTLNLSVNAQTGTTYTFVLSDNYKLVTLDNASNIAVTVPTNASVAFPIGSQIHFTQKGDGIVTIAGDSGVTVNAPIGLKTRAKWSTCSIIKIDTDTWIMLGDATA